MSDIDPTVAVNPHPRSMKMDRYRMDEESSGSDVMLASAAAQIITNARSNGLPTSPSSSARMSRNSVAASRLLRSRKDRRYKSPSTLQPSGESDDQSIASLETIPTAARPRRVIHLTPIVTSPTSPITSPVSLYSDPTSTGSYATSPNSNPTSPNSGILSSSSSRPSVRSRRERVAGGAAAKLFGFQSHDEGDDKYENSHDSTLNDDPLQNLAETSQELDEVRQKTRNEFLTGLQENSRYRSGADTDRDETRTEVLSEASVPSILNRSEVFHENATAAILALLTPRSQGGFGDEKASFAGGTSGALYDIQVTTSKSGISFAHSPSVSGSAFCSPRNNDNGGHFNGISALVDTTRDSMPKSPKPLLSFIAERKIENIQGKMRDPNQQLADLLVAIATPELGQLMDRGYMVRRKNACGALKVLTANPANRKSICWTVGALPALTSVLADTGRAFIDVFTRREFVDARSRAVASLLNLCIPKENRLPIFHSDGLMQAIISVIDDDHGEARQGCTGILAYLAKTRENRLLMVQVPGLLDAVASVIKPIIFKSPVKKKKYHWDNNDDTSASLSSEEGHRNESMTSEGSDKFTVTNSMASSPRHTDDDDDDDYDDEADEDDDDDEDSDMTPTRATSPILPQLSKAEEYDKSPNTFLNGSRQNVFAFLFHMIKEKDNTFVIARHILIVNVLVEIAELQESPSHVHSVKILAHLTRHRENSKWIVFRLRVVVPCFVLSSSSDNDEARTFACYALQNLSQDKACRQEVATTKGLVMALCQRARQSTDANEKVAAISALKNLTDEPANLIPMTNTPECFATLMQIAHGGDEGISEMMQYLACDALATLSHWLRKIATSGHAMDQPNKKMTELFVPSLKTVTWDQWK